MLSERSQTHKTIYYTISLIWAVKDRQTYSDCQGLVGWKGGVTATGYGVSFWVWFRCSGIRACWWWHSSLNILKIIRLHTLNKRTVWFANISVELLLSKNRTQGFTKKSLRSRCDFSRSLLMRDTMCQHCVLTAQGDDLQWQVQVHPEEPHNLGTRPTA